MKIEKRRQKYVKICPRCKSTNIKTSNFGGAFGIVIGAPTVYRCIDCGFTNYTFPEIRIEKKRRIKKVKIS